MTDKLEERIQSLREVLSKFPHNLKLWKELAARLWEQGARESLKCVEKALILSPHSQNLIKQKQEILASGLFTLGSLQFRHSGEISKIQVTQEGKILSAGLDGTCRLWDISGRELVRFAGHQGPVRDLSISPDNSLCISASDDETLRLWEIKTGQELLILRGHKGGVTSVLFSPDNKTILSGGEDFTARVWLLDEAREILAFEKHKNPLSALALSTDGKLAASADESGLCVLWLTSTGKVGKGFQAHQEKINSLCFSANKRNILTASDDGTLGLWDGAKGEKIKVLEGHQGPVSQGYFLEGEEQIISCSQDKTIRIWSVEEGTEQRILKGHTRGVNSFALHPNGKLGVSCGQEHYIRLWKFAKGEQLYNPHGPDGKVIHGDCNRYLATVGGEEFCQLWNPNTGTEIKRLSWPGITTCKIAISPGGDKLVVGENNGALRLWDVAQETVLMSLIKHESPITCLGFSPDGEKIVSADYSGEVILWEVETGNIRVDGQIGLGAIYSAEFFPFGDFMALGTQNNLALVVNLETAEDSSRFEKHQGPVKRICITYEEKIISSSTNEEIWMWDSTTGKEIFKFEGHQAPVVDTALLTDEKYLVSGDEKGIILVWDLKTGEKHGEISLDDGISKICVNAEEQEILVALHSGCIRRIPEYNLL